MALADWDLQLKVSLAFSLGMHKSDMLPGEVSQNFPFLSFSSQNPATTARIETFCLSSTDNEGP